MKQRTRKLLTLLLIAAMVMSLMVPALAADTAQSETPYTYDAGDYTFGKISHPNSAPGQPDGLVDYTGNGTVAVTGTADGADGQGDRGQSYAWAAMAYGDYVYVGTCYAAMGQTLTAMDTVMGHKFDEETMRGAQRHLQRHVLLWAGGRRQLRRRAREGQRTHRRDDPAHVQVAQRHRPAVPQRHPLQG